MIELAAASSRRNNNNEWSASSGIVFLLANSSYFYLHANTFLLNYAFPMLRCRGESCDITIRLRLLQIL
jgi:hypothetical protein